MSIRRKIVLEDGAVYEGTAFGALKEIKAELVFNTSMAGYQEILSDPSYTGQAVVMTYPLIGNYGMCADDYETETPTVYAMIVHEYTDETANFRAECTLGSVMEKYGIVGVQGIDTRKLARHIRDIGSMRAAIVDADCCVEEVLKELLAWKPAPDYVSRVSKKKAYDFTEIPVENPKVHVVAIDCGIKKNILRDMARRGIQTTVVPWNTSAEEILSYHPDGLFISNGPGDPQDVKETIETVRALIGKLPIFGICLGHQILALAYGATTYKLKFGHRGGNHPVQDLATGKLEITSQNHSFAVDEASLSGTPLVKTHINLLDQTIEGMACPKDHVFSVQYHPESAPGPQDSSYLFDRFLDQMLKKEEE